MGGAPVDKRNSGLLQPPRLCGLVSRAHSMSPGRSRMVQVMHLDRVGLVRVSLSEELAEYRVLATGSTDELVAEYFTGDRTDALRTADAMLAELANRAGWPWP